jgi:hypothetical protein
MAANRSAHGTLRLLCDRTGCTVKFSPKRPLAAGAPAGVNYDIMVHALRERAYLNGWEVAGRDDSLTDRCPTCKGVEFELKP